MTYQCNPAILELFTTRTKCWMCKHRFAEPYLLPVEKPERGKWHPRFNSLMLFHMKDTHGIPARVAREWITGKIYGMDIGLFGIRGLEHSLLEDD